MTATLAVALGILVVALAWGAAWCRRTLRRTEFAQRSEAQLLRSHLGEQDLRIDLSQHDLGYLDGAVVFIVGGGGTIGGRLAHELGALHYRLLVLVDNDEDGLYRTLRRLLAQGHSPEAVSVELADVRDGIALARLFDRYRPEVVFHYANYKSATLGESSPRAFVRVNVAGMVNLLDEVRRSDSVRTFVYVSSDKAESASTAYGRTKRVCELLLHAEATHSRTAGRPSPVRYASIRYCNVLDAAGSFAIPTFRDQILAVDPVTVRRMADGSIPNRYFMDIRTAAMIAVVAGAHGRDANVYSLNSRLVAPIDVDEIVRTIAREYGVRNIGRWFDRHVTYVPGSRGEKTSEALGTGTPVPGCPLVDLHAPGPSDTRAFRESVGELLAASEKSDGTELVDLLDALLRTHDPAAQRAQAPAEQDAAVPVGAAPAGNG